MTEKKALDTNVNVDSFKSTSKKVKKLTRAPLIKPAMISKKGAIEGVLERLKTITVKGKKGCLCVFKNGESSFSFPAVGAVRFALEISGIDEGVPMSPYMGKTVVLEVGEKVEGIWQVEVGIAE